MLRILLGEGVWGGVCMLWPLLARVAWELAGKPGWAPKALLTTPTWGLVGYGACIFWTLLAATPCGVM